MSFYKRLYNRGQLQLVTGSTYRRAPLFLSERDSAESRFPETLRLFPRTRRTAEFLEYETLRCLT